MNEITAAGAAEQFTQLADSIDRHYRSATNAQHLAQNLQRAIYHGAKIMLALVDAGILCRKAGTAPWRDRAHFIGATNLGSEHAELTCVWSVSVMSWLREKHPNLVKSDLGIYDFWITKVKDGKAVTDANGEPVSITTDYTPASWLAHNQARADDYILACRAIATILSALPSTDVEANDGAKVSADSGGKTQTQLAAMLGVVESTIRNWSKRSNVPARESHGDEYTQGEIDRIIEWAAEHGTKRTSREAKRIVEGKAAR